MTADTIAALPARTRPWKLRPSALLATCIGRAEARHQRRQLRKLPDHLLRDIGLTRADAFDLGR